MELVISKSLTVFWGVVCIFFAFFVGGMSDTIIESINKIGSLVNGPLLAVFLMGMLTRRVNGQGAIGGLFVGFVLNLLLWKYVPKISWLWWNVIGFFVAYGTGYLISMLFPKPDSARFDGTLFQRVRGSLGVDQTDWRPYYVVLALYGTGILVLLVAITYL